MKKIVTFFFIIGLLLGGYGFIYSISMLIALNGFGNTFEVKSPDKFETKIAKDSYDINIKYSYEVGKNEYSSEYNMFVDYFENCNIDTLIVKYNTNFPMVSYIEGVPLKISNHKSGIFLSTIFLLFLILVWKLSNRDKWIKTYEDVGNRPWLYPADKSVKNPWKRLMNRLFQK